MSSYTHRVIVVSLCSQVRVLLAANADARAQNAYGETPLHLASREGHAECVKELLAGGARVSAYTQQGGHSAIHYAAGGGHLPVIKQLEKALGPEALVLASGGGNAATPRSSTPAKKGKGGGKKSKSPVRASMSAGGGPGRNNELSLGPPVVLASINGLSASGELPMLRAVRALGGASACTDLAANQFKEVPDELVGVEDTLQYLGSSYASPFDPPAAKVKSGGKKGGGAKGGAKKGGKKK